MGTGSKAREDVSPYGLWDTPAEPRRAAACLQQQLSPVLGVVVTPRHGEEQESFARTLPCSYRSDQR